MYWDEFNHLCVSMELDVAEYWSQDSDMEKPSFDSFKIKLLLYDIKYQANYYVSRSL